MPPIFLSTDIATVYAYGDVQDAWAQLIVVPSLINRSYILDMTESHSMVRYLAAQGIAVYMVDWHEPTKDQADYDIEDYISSTIEPLIYAVSQQSPLPISLLGYCMGGIIALASAMRQKQYITNLVLLATPWDFHIPAYDAIRPDIAFRDSFQQLLDRAICVPPEVIQSLFYYLNPAVVHQKFSQLATLEQGEVLTHFIAIEQWANDGIAMSARIAKTCMVEWLMDNQLMKNKWHIKGSNIALGDMTLPVFAISPTMDSIVPETSMVALKEGFPNLSFYQPDAGHVGMVAGKNARRYSWDPIADWLRKQTVE